jgi:hypothetical protein
MLSTFTDEGRLLPQAEYRDLGYDDQSAISLGVAKTGWIISAAGLVMAIAFGGMQRCARNVCTEQYSSFAVADNFFRRCAHQVSFWLMNLR